MATYTVRAPDGKTITLQGPDGASQADILAQAQKLYQPKAQTVQAPDGKTWTADPAKILQQYQNARNSVVSKFSDPVKQKAALMAFDSDPRAQAMRQAAGLAPLSTRQGDVRAAAKNAVQSHSGVTDFVNAAGAAAERMAFGIPERIDAAIHQYLPPSKLEANFGEQPVPHASNYLQQLANERAANDQLQSRSPAGSLTGTILGAAGAGGVAGKAIKGAAAIADASAIPIVSKIGNVLSRLTTLNKGQTVANLGKTAIAGGAAGGAQAGGTGGDPVTGAEVGAVAAPAVAGLGSLAGRFLLRPAADILGLSNAGSYLRRFTDAPLDAIKQALAERQKAGVTPTLFEVLPQADRNRLMEHTIAGRDPVVEQVLQHIQDRAGNVGPEMADTLHAATSPQRLQVQRQIVNDLERARGSSSGVPAAGAPGEDAQAALLASQSPSGMQDLYHKEAGLIMAPHDATPVVSNFNHLLPQIPGPDGTALETDPELSGMIRTAGGRLVSRPAGEPINVGEISNMISRLRGIAFKGGNDGALAENAAGHLEDVIGQNAPEAGQAVQMMRDAYAARKRMAEGMKEGWFTRLRNAQQVGTNDAAGNTLANAHDTPEGQTGLFLGQANRLLHDFGGSPASALGTAGDIASGDTTRELAQNIGQQPTDRIANAADLQAQGIKTLSSAGAQTNNDSKVGDGSTLAQGILALSPHSFITTKMHWLKQLGQATFIPDAKAKVLGDMLFSTDPGLTQKALDYLSSRGSAGKQFAQSVLQTAPVTAAQIGADNFAGNSQAPDASAETALPPLPDVAAMPPTSAPQTQNTAPTTNTPSPPQTSEASPYALILQNTYAQENPDLVNLMQRVKAQESSGDQSKVSKKGAVGIAQVMPDTAPEAAKLAGVPWDPKAYKEDPAYNEILGHAYLAEQLRKYGGDVPRALAAYNAGPGNVDAALSSAGAGWLSALPAETQDYVARVGG